MSERIQKHDNRATIRWKLLTGVSALALANYISSANPAKAEDSSQRQVWIELGGQLSKLDDGQETFAPAIMDGRPSIFEPSRKFERPPLYSLDESGKISFQPEDSDWTFSGSLRYGRSSSARHVGQQTTPPSPAKYLHYSGHTLNYPAQPAAAKFADTRSQNSESHLILDFQAGKDIGLGMFGSKDGTSVLNLGVCFAQFSGKTNIALKSDPDFHVNYKYFHTGTIIYNNPTAEPFHSNAASLRATRSFHGVGPSISWTASAPLAGNPQSSELAFDWGVNAALLFGRQRTKAHHQTTGRYHHYGITGAYRPITYQNPATPDHTRSRNVTVPNVGGFAGLSYNYADAKLSFGYRVDFFFGAIDGGIDAGKKENRGFYGPYASISIGLGD